MATWEVETPDYLVEFSAGVWVDDLEAWPEEVGEIRKGRRIGGHIEWTPLPAKDVPPQVWLDSLDELQSNHEELLEKAKREHREGWADDLADQSRDYDGTPRPRRMVEDIDL
jgi:hypothetical protein